MSADNTIKIDDDAYQALSGMKTQGDTFNDVVHDALCRAGVLDE